MPITFGSPTVHFRDRLTKTKPGMALVYDLGGFTRFANHPNAPRYIPRLINEISSAIAVVIHGGDPYWISHAETYYQPLTRPVHEKFLGDGALYVWTANSERELTRSTFVIPLCNRLRDLRKNFARVVALMKHHIPIASIPREIRVGLAMGDVLRLSRRDSQKHEYVGTCINLASRLQSHCTGIGFLAAASIGMDKLSGAENGYSWAIAKGIKGFPEEDVIVDRLEFEHLKPTMKRQKFAAYE